MTKITPSRGYCIELATALAVSMASLLGMPISTTHCLVSFTLVLSKGMTKRTSYNVRLLC